MKSYVVYSGSARCPVPSCARDVCRCQLHYATLCALALWRNLINQGDSRMIAGDE